MAGVIAFLGFGSAALVCALAGVWIWRGGEAPRADRAASALALGLSALWCLACAAIGPDRVEVQVLETARNLAWIAVLCRAFANDGRDASLRLVRPVVGALIFVALLRLPLLAVAGRGVLETSALFGIMTAVGALVLTHNLYAGAAGASRRLIAWNAGALALFWGYELNHHTIAWLGGGAAPELAGLRGVVMMAVGGATALGFARSAPGLRFRPSRAVTFQLLSLAVIGSYLAAMLFLAERVAVVSGDLARITQVGFLLAAAGLALLWLPSQRLRGWLRVTALKHLFRHRYDYRGEWIRFTHTIGQSGIRVAGGERSLPERAIQSLADIAESPAGLLLVPDRDGVLELEAQWRWPLADVPTPAAPLELSRILEREELILDFDEARRGVTHHGEAAWVPDWLTRETRAWAGVPLLHRGQLIGLVVLARPLAERRLDWEDFDLLGVAGQQVASYLAERAGQQALEEANRFDEFNRRMAFVMHDIKNLSSQMGLLARNAERHADKPEFRADMLVTLRSSTDKLNALLARLGRYGTTPGARSGNPPERIDLTPLAHGIARRLRPAHDIRVTDGGGPCAIVADRERIEQALLHLVQNAVDASEGGAPVVIAVRNDGLRAVIEIADRGPGMSAQFIRHDLFKPFVSTKEGGFGIGAHEAREAVRAMGGRMEVDSREGLGTRFTITLPLAEAVHLRAERAATVLPRETAA